MVPLVKAGGQVFLGLPHERLVQADYSLQQQDRKLLVDATTQEVNLSLPPISELIEGTHFQLVIVKMGLGISIDGSALPSDVEQVFIQVKESEYKMSFIQATRAQGAKRFLGVLNAVPASPVLGDEFQCSQDLTIDGKIYREGEILTFDGTDWTAGRMVRALKSFTVFNAIDAGNVPALLRDCGPQDTSIVIRAQTENISVTLPQALAGDVGRKLTVHAAAVGDGFTAEIGTSSTPISMNGTLVTQYTFETQGDSLLLQVTEDPDLGFMYVPI